MKTQSRKAKITRGKFPVSMGIAGVMLLLFSLTLFGADATDQALEQIKASAKEAIAAANLLTTQSAKIRTVSEAVDALKRFYAIVQRMNDSCDKILKDLGPQIDPKRLSLGIMDIREQTKAAGINFALVIAKLPQTVLTADAFTSVLQEINTELTKLKKDMDED